MRLRSVAWGVTTLAAMGTSASATAQLLPAPGPVEIRQSAAPALNPQHERAKIAAEQAYKRGEYTDSIELTSTVISADPKDHIAYYLRASARVELGQQINDVRYIRSGIEDARESLKLGGTTNVNYYLPYLYGMTILARMEDRVEHADVAVKIATSVIERAGIKPEDKANMLFQRGEANVAQKKFEAAVVDYSDAVKLMPMHLGAHVGLCGAYVSAGKKEQAQASFDRAVQAFPKNPLVFNNRGMFLQEQKKYAEAIEDFTRAIDLDPNHFVAFMNRGYTLMNDGDPQTAESDFTQALRINTHQPMVYSLRGTARLTQGKLEQALQDYNKTVELDPKNAVAHAELGFARFFSKDYRGAGRAFDQARALDSKLEYLAPWQYWSSAVAGDVEAANRKFAPVAAKNRLLRDWTDTLIVFLMGKIGEQDVLAAIDVSNQEQAKAQQCEAYFFMGQKKIQAGDNEAAKEYFRQAVATNVRYLSAFRGAQFGLNDFSTDVADAVQKLNQ